MAKQLQVELVAVEQKVWTGEAEMVVARTTEGELGILPGHAPVLGQLAEPGEVRIHREQAEPLVWEVNGGFLSVTADGVTILAETAAPAARAGQASGASQALGGQAGSASAAAGH